MSNVAVCRPSFKIKRRENPRESLLDSEIMIV